MDYPRDRFEVQVLDDSTDETQSVAALAVRRAALEGIDIKYIHRDDRSGYKAGALEAGMQQAAVSSSPSSTRISSRRRTFCCARSITSPTRQVGMVQARWGHINQDYSLLTRIQSILLDGHFVLEHGGRNRAGHFFNFNGTAGVWRRAAIADAGGWQHDTLTEDLDLSYRAQLRGWRFHFIPDLIAPAEVPVEMNAFKTQQHRWAKGSIQTCIKLLPRILQSEPAVRRKGRGLLPSDGEFQLRADGPAVDPDVPVHGDSLQHGLVRDAADRHPAVLCGDDVGRELLHGVPARGLQGAVGHAAEVSALPDVDRDWAGGEQRTGGLRSTLRTADRVHAHAEVSHRAGQRRVDWQEVPAGRPGAAAHRALARDCISPLPCSTRCRTGSTGPCRSWSCSRSDSCYTGLLSIVQQFADDSVALNTQVASGD